MTTCFGYTRVSTAKQGEGVSLEVQKEEITRYADKHGLTISRWFEEKETAAKSGRPVFNAITAPEMLALPDQHSAMRFNMQKKKPTEELR